MKHALLKIVISTLSAVVIACGSGSAVLAKSWEEAIQDVEAKADKYWEYGKSRGAFTMLGTAFNEIGIPQHKCAILGRMLGLAEHVQHLEEFEEPEFRAGLSEEELQEFMYHAQFLRNWAFIARKLVDSADEDKQQIWNLDCVGKQGIAAHLFVGIEDPSANLVVDGTDLRVLGNFEPGFYERFEVKVHSNPEIKRVVLGSGGGSVRDAILAGLLIRSKGLSTTLSENCYSACPLAFLGGVRRTIWSPYPKLAFHRVSQAGGPEVPFDDPVYELIETYIQEMGADPDFVMRHIFAASPSEFSYPDYEDLCRSAAVTWIQRFCSSEDY